MSLNMIILSGRITSDPDMSYTTGGMAVTSFSIAVDTYTAKKGKGTMFMKCVAFDRTAEKVSQYIGKGDFIEVAGKLDESRYTDKDKIERVSYSVVCDKVEFTPAKGKARREVAASNSEVSDVTEVASDGNPY